MLTIKKVATCIHACTDRPTSTCDVNITITPEQLTFHRLSLHLIERHWKSNYHYLFQAESGNYLQPSRTVTFWKLVPAQ